MCEGQCQSVLVCESPCQRSVCMKIRYVRMLLSVMVKCWCPLVLPSGNTVYALLCHEEWLVKSSGFAWWQHSVCFTLPRGVAGQILWLCLVATQCMLYFAMRSGWSNPLALPGGNTVYALLCHEEWLVKSSGFAWWQHSVCFTLP